MDKQIKNKQFIQQCKRLISLLLFSYGAVIALDTNSSIAAPTGKLENWRFSPQSSQLEFSVSAASRPQFFYLSQPPRIVIDLPDTKLGNVPTKENYNGAIQGIRISQLNEDVTRIVMDLAPGVFFDRDRVQLQPVSWQNPTVWVFRPSIVSNGNFLGPTNYPIGDRLTPDNYSPSQLPTYPSYTPQTPNNYSPSQLPTQPLYTPQTPRTIPPAQLPGNFSPGMYNTSPMSPGAIAPPIQAPPLTLPPLNMNNGNPQQPTVRVPPITNNNSFPQNQNPVLPPATFPSPSGNFNSPPSIFPAP